MSQVSRTVLVVDDSPEDREMYRRYLLRGSETAYTLLEASLGHQGLTLWQQHQPDVVLLDYRLPDLDGLEFLTQLTALADGAPLPVIVVTGQGSEAIAVKAMKAGAQDYLIKGRITPETLKWAVDHAIESVRLLIQVKQATERERIVSQMSLKVRQTLNLEEILQTAVDEVRQYLKTDRVLIFQLHSDGSGTVITESVGDAWTPILSTTLYDPCLSSEYIEPFRQGLVTSKPDIYDGSIDPCHVELLAKLQVRANLVVPVLQNDQLWGMLIVQHCAAPRPWQDSEIALLKDLSTQLSIALKQAELYQQVQAELAERKQIETVLRRSEERFRTSVENMLDCFAVYRAVRNEQGEVVDFQAEYVNDAACVSSQIPREKHLSRGLCELMPAYRSNKLFDDFCQVVETGESLVKEDLVYDDQPGQSRLRRAYDVRVAKYGDGYVVTWRDITDRKQAETALRRSEERYRTLFETMEDGFCVLRMIFDDDQTPIDYRFLEANPAFERQTGLLQAVGKTARQLVPDLEQHWFELYGRVALTREPLRFEQGSEAMNRWFEVYAFPVGEPEDYKVALLFKDVSDRKTIETERERLLQQEQSARKEAERANRIKDEFLAILSHELRSPLNPILGWSRLLQTHQLSPTKTAEALATIERNAKLQSQLIDDLLDVARILRGKLRVKTAPIHPAGAIEAARETVMAAAAAKQIQIKSVLSEVGQVAADPTRLQQIIWNLLSNAIKFTPSQGQVEIRLQQVDQWAQIIIKDTGKGIKPDFLPYLFESFRQEDASITRSHGGLGLGLAIVRYLVEAHGGSVTAHSEGEGKGATFIVQIPVISPSAQAPPSSKALLDDPDLTGLRVMTVDDDPDACELISALLTEYGAEVLTMSSAAKVLETLSAFQPDILVSDIGMPDMDGYTLLQRIRTLPPEQGGEIPAIAVSAYAREEDRCIAIKKGFQRHIPKPLDPEILAFTILELTEG